MGKTMDEFKAIYILENNSKLNVDYDKALAIAVKALKYCIEHEIDFNKKD